MWNYQMAIIGHPLPLVWSPPSGSRAQHFQQRVSYGLKTMIGDHGSWWSCGSLTMMIIVATFEEGWLGESAEPGGWWPITCDSNKPKEQEVCLWSSWWKMVIMKVTSMEDFKLNIEKKKAILRQVLMPMWRAQGRFWKKKQCSKKEMDEVKIKKEMDEVKKWRTLSSKAIGRVRSSVMLRRAHRARLFLQFACPVQPIQQQKRPSIDGRSSTVMLSGGMEGGYLRLLVCCKKAPSMQITLL